MLHFLRAIFDALPSAAGILLATLAFALVFVKELDEKLKDKRMVRWTVAIVLCAFGLAGFISDRVQNHEESVRRQNSEAEQKQAVDSIGKELQKSELSRVSDTRYLQGKLDVFAQFAPAIMKLAQATEENTRKQYEVKVASDKELYEFTADVVKRVREFSRKYAAKSEQRFMESTNWAMTHRGANDDEIKQHWLENSQTLTALSFEEQAEFEQKILPDALYARQELRKRKVAEPELNPLEKSLVEMVFRGSLAGAHPELSLANYLESLARPLKPETTRGSPD